MRGPLLVATMLLVACSSETSSSPTVATRSSCGPTPSPPLSAEKCFGEFLKDKVQTTNPKAPNYVPPACPCAYYIVIPEPDGGWTDGTEIPFFDASAD